MRRASLSTRWQSGAAALCVAMSAAITSGCGFSLNEANVIKLSAIQSAGNNLRVRQTMQLKTEAPVLWSVNGIPGGNAEIGTISSTGIYTAPGIVPLPNNQVTIESASEIYAPSKGSFNIAVLNPIPIVNAITPGSFAEGVAQVAITGSDFIYGAQIPVERRCGPHHLYLRYTACRQHHRKYAGYLSGGRGQSRSWFSNLQEHQCAGSAWQGSGQTATDRNKRSSQ